MSGRRFGGGGDGGEGVAAAEQPPRGLSCPACGQRELREVVQTRPKNDYIYRQRKCLCGYVATTTERVIGGG